MRNYYKTTEADLIHEKIVHKSEIERIDHALSFFEVSKHHIKEMLWNRYLSYKKDTGNILIVKYEGGNSGDPENYKYYEAKKITDNIYETEVTSNSLYWLNMNRNYLQVVFDWL